MTPLKVERNTRGTHLALCHSARVPRTLCHLSTVLSGNCTAPPTWETAQTTSDVRNSTLSPSQQYTVPTLQLLSTRARNNKHFSPGTETARNRKSET